MVKAEDMNPDSTFSEFQDLFAFPESLLTNTATSSSSDMLARLVTGYLDTRGQPSDPMDDVPPSKEIMLGARPISDAVFLLTSASDRVRH
jgi:hypothetical protein